MDNTRFLGQCCDCVWRMLMLTAGLLASAGQLAAEADLPLRLEGAGGKLRIDAKGFSLMPSMTACPSSEATGENFWTMTGTFTDTEGFTCKGAGIVAKGYNFGNTFGVMLWNTSDKASAFTLNVPGLKLVSASAPENGTVDAFSELAPQSVRLLVWKRP